MKATGSSHGELLRVCRPWKLILLVAAFPWRELNKEASQRSVSRHQRRSRDAGGAAEQPEAVPELLLPGGARALKQLLEAWVLGALFILHVSIITSCESESVA